MPELYTSNTMNVVAFPPLPEDSIRALDQLRQRLSQLSTSLASLKVDLERNEPLPTWSSLQSSAQILSHNMGQLLSTFDTHRAFYSAAHAYPLPTYPGHSQENLLNQLLRKRLEPAAEDWIKQHEDGQEREGSKNVQSDKRTGNLSKEELQDLWLHAGPASTSIVKAMIEDGAFDDDFTVAERESGIEEVNTGLRRKLWEDDEEDEEHHPDKMQEEPDTRQEANLLGLNAMAQPMPVESILKFMNSGKLPAG